MQDPLMQVSSTVQGLPSSHPPGIGVPLQSPSEHMSGLVHWLPSLHDWDMAGVVPIQATTSAAPRSCQNRIRIE
jgi:hypothetical protein